MLLGKQMLLIPLRVEKSTRSHDESDTECEESSIDSIDKL
jgi:hypothetical protein